MKSLIYITLFLASINLFGQIDNKIASWTAKNFEISNWDEKTYFLDWKIYGDEGKYETDNRIAVSKIKLDIYDGSEAENIKVVINSDTAEVYVDTKSAGGDDVLYAKGESFDLEGKTWLWESSNKKISVFNGLTINLNDTEKDSKSTASSTIGYFFYPKNENIFELERNVKIVDETSEIECDYLIIKTDGDSIGSTKTNARSIDAKGNVEILWDKQATAKADSLIIKPNEDIAQLKGNASLEDSKSKTKVFGSQIDLDKAKNKAKVYSNKAQRAKAEIPQKQEDGSVDIINIYANEILMSMRDENIEVNFVGNVVLEGKGMNASCNTMTSLAIKKEGAKDFELLQVIGNGKVNMSQGKRSAFAQNFIYTPANGEVILNDSAYMQDEEKGVRLNAYTIVLDKDENKAIAVSNADDEKSFVHIKINEINSDGIASDSELNIFSRSVLSIKDGDNITLNFEKDVKVKSASIQATCQKIDVYATGNQKGRSQVKKIEAFDDIIIKQEQYLATSELARIFPDASLSNLRTESKKSYIELLRSKENPDIRPRIILPPIGNIGFYENITEGKEYKNTEITSDKQFLIEGEEADRYFFEGDVTVDSTDMQATCKKIEVIMTKGENASTKKISHIIASDDVIISQGQKEATGQRVDIFPDEEMLSLSGEPVVLDKETGSKATGHKMTYRKGVKGISIEGEKAEEGKPAQRPTITLPPIKY